MTTTTTTNKSTSTTSTARTGARAPKRARARAKKGRTPEQRAAEAQALHDTLTAQVGRRVWGHQSTRAMILSRGHSIGAPLVGSQR